MKVHTSYHQERLWFIDEFESDNLYISRPVYHNVPLVVNIEGDLDVNALEQSLNKVINRHEALRTLIITEESKPVQFIYPEADFKLAVISGDTAKENISLLIEKEIKRPFDREKGLLVRGLLVKSEHGISVLVITFHHLIVDKYSLKIFLDEVIIAYESGSDGKSPELKPLELQYADFSQWQKELQPKLFKSLLLYWKRKLNGKLQALELPTDSQRALIHVFEESRYRFDIPLGLNSKIKEYSELYNVNVGNIFFAAYKILLHRYSSLEEIVVGTSGLNRNQPGTKEIVGPIANLLVLRTFITPNSTFRSVLSDLSRDLSEAYKYQEIPFDRLVLELNPEKDMSRTALFDILFQYDGESSSFYKTGNTVFKVEETNLGWGKYDLNLLMSENQGGTLGTLVYNKLYFNHSTISRMIKGFLMILDAALEQPDQNVSSFTIVTDEDKHLLLDVWNNNKAIHPDLCIHQLFEERTKQFPDNIALEYGEKKVCYSELNKQANRVANYLRSAFNIIPDDLIGVCLDPSDKMIDVLLGILKAGAAYVPVDPSIPESRINYILMDSNCKLTITDDKNANKVRESYAGTVISYSEIENLANRETDPQIINQPGNVAYVIYTSGTTGAPKGCLVTHKNVVRLMLNDRHNFDFNENDVWILTHSFGFDFSVWEMYGALLYGAKLIVPDRDDVRNIESYSALIRQHKVTVLNQTPSAFYNFIAAIKSKDDRSLTSLRYVIFGGDKLIPHLLKDWLEIYSLSKVKLINMFGITETTVHVTYYELKESDINSSIGASPIGKVLPETNIYLLDNNLNLVPVGVTGEIFVGGSGVTRGYLNNNALTNERFIKNPYNHNEIIYKSGDQARYLETGEIEYIGRKDQQVKIRGYRIETAEIEYTLLRNSKVKAALVIAREHEKEKVLCAYIVCNQELSVTEIRADLAQNLPDYMIPSYFITLESIPLTDNGKVDVRSLPGISEFSMKSGVGYAAPRNEMEEKLVAIWEQVLKIKNIGIKDNFFERGGHSLKATQLLSEIYKLFEVKVELKFIFTHPTIERLSELITNLVKTSYEHILPVKEDKYYELSYAQRRLWILCQFEEDSTAYNMPGAVNILGKFNSNAFIQAVQALAERHESLRTIFFVCDGVPKQKIVNDFRFVLETADLRTLDKEIQEKTSKELYEEYANRVFNLVAGPLFGFKLITLEANKHLLLYNIHHIINDGWSNGVILNELSYLYKAFHTKQEISLEPLSVQYKDYAYWHNSLIKSGAFSQDRIYWLEKLKDKPNGVLLPYDYSRKSIQTFNGGRKEFIIDKELTLKLYTLCLNRNVTLFMSLLTFVDIILNKYSGQKDIVIGAPIAGRKQPELFNMIGFLVNTLVYRTEVNPHESFYELLEKVKEDAQESYEHQDYPFDLLVEELGLHRDLSQSPVFNVMIAHNNTETADKEHKSDELILTDYESINEYNMSKFDLIFFVNQKQDQIAINLEYNSDLFNRNTIERLGTNFINLITEIVKNPSVPLSEINYIVPQEFDKVTNAFNSTLHSIRDITVQEMLEEAVDIYPHKTAVVDGDRKMSYSELNEQSNKFANYLREELGVRPNDIVGISIDRSFDMIVAILGVIKSGAAYLAIDPNYPANRVLHMLEDSKTKILVVDVIRPLQIGGFTGTIINMNDCRQLVNSFSQLNPVVLNKPTDILYVIYTSGSTGVPNGALLSHSNLSNLIQWQNEKTSIDSSKKCLQFTSINFCVSFQEIFTTLASGGELYLIGEYDRQDIGYLMNFLQKHEIENLYLPFSYLNFLFNESSRVGESFRPKLEQIITAGEQLKITAGLKEFLERNSHIQLHNQYGSSEMHVVTSFTLNAASADLIPLPPAGKPIANVKIYILDEQKKVVPIGAWGELYMEGYSEVLGYINNEKLSSEKLILHDTFSDNVKRLYRTGDIGRWLDDGNIELNGRKDSQVKVRGFRVEPGEIESKLLSIQGVKDCVVLIRKDKQDQNYIVAFVVLVNVKIEALKELINESMPQFMIPKFKVMDALPLMPNGKVDREKLPAVDDTEVVYAPPADIVEEQLVEIWKELLGKDKISVYDNFFENGGHSLKAVMMISKVHKAFEKEVPLREVFRCPVLKDLADYIRKKGTTAFDPIKSVENLQQYPVSSSQKRLFILNQLENPNIAYNIFSVFELGRVDVETIRFIFSVLMQRHEVLRTRFELSGDEVVQVVMGKDNIYLPISFYHSASENENTNIIKGFSQPFDLGSAPLFRIGVIQSVNDRVILMLDMHHIISDGVSMKILMEEFLFLLNHKEELPDINIHYKDYAFWQHKRLVSGLLKSHEDYWLEQLFGDLPVLELFTDYPRPARQGFKGSAIYFEIDESLSEKLTSKANETNTTLNMILLASFSTLLYKYTSQEDILIGSPSAGRYHADLQNIVGPFINTLVMRSRPTATKNFLELLKEVKTTSLEALVHEEYPFDELITKLKLKPELSRNPLFDVMFIFQNTQRGGSIAEKNSAKTILPSVTTTKFDLTLIAGGTGEKLSFGVEYNSELFKEETIQRFKRHYISILETIATNPSVSLKDIEILSSDEKQMLIHQFNDTFSHYPQSKTLPSLVEEQVVRTPDKIAIRFFDNTLTYLQLHERSGQLAETLKSKGVTKGKCVGLLLDRSAEMVLAILAVLKTGGIYLPIDPDFPASRIEWMLKDTGAVLLLSNRKEKVNLDLETLDLNDSSQYLINTVASEVLDVRCSSQDIAYILYTSGSTGNPKGVMVRHFSVVNFLLSMQQEPGLTINDRMLSLTNLTFDISILEIFLPLITGAELIITAPETATDLPGLMRYIEHTNPTIMQATPTLWKLLIDNGWEGKNDLKILCGGERLSAYLASQLVTRSAELWNLYGPTETTIWSAAKRISRDDTNITLGKPIRNTSIFILDEQQKLVPVGVKGEIYIGGEGLAKGYLNNASLTSSKFIDLLIDKSVIHLYRTGDFGKWLSNGEIDFLGRNDDQVKIRGFRVELGEVEFALVKLEGIRQAVVLAKEDQKKNKYLIAYCTADKSINISNLKETLRGYLPSFMIPTYIFRIDSFPMTTSGKIDMKKLGQDVEIFPVAKEIIPPRDVQDEKLLRIWSEGLQLNNISIEDDFFALGGSSIDAMNISLKVHKEFGKRLLVREIFSRPVLKDLSDFIRSLDNNVYRGIVKARLQDSYGLSSAQKRLFVINQMSPESLAYNMCGAIEVFGKPDIQSIEKVMQKLVDRHETLRTRFGMVDGDIHQFIENDIKIRVEHFSMEAGYNISDCVKLFKRPFDLKKAPLVRIGIAERKPSDFILIFDLHHIICDGRSLEILSEEFISLYKGEELPSYPLQYKDYVEWSFGSPENESQEKDKNYWMNLLSGHLPVLNLPLDYPRPAVMANVGESIYFEIDEKSIIELRKIAILNNGTLYSLLLSVFNVLLKKYTRQNDIVIGTTIAGRPHVDLANIIGMFANTNVIRSFPQDEKGFLDFFSEVQRSVLQTIEHQQYQFDDVVDLLHIKRDLSRNPIFDVMFTYQKANDNSKEGEIKPGVKEVIYERTTSIFDITLNIVEAKHKIHVTAEYNSTLFRKETILLMFERYKMLLKEIIKDADKPIKDLSFDLPVSVPTFEIDFDL